MALNLTITVLAADLLLRLYISTVQKEKQYLFILFQQMMGSWIRLLYPCSRPGKGRPGRCVTFKDAWVLLGIVLMEPGWESQPIAVIWRVTVTRSG